MMMQKTAKPPLLVGHASASVPRLSTYTILGNRICYGLTALPSFADELPDLISTLEAGGPVATSRIQDRFRRKVIENILAELPLVQEQGVWRKDPSKSSTSIRKYINQALLHAGQVIQPTELSPAQTKAARFPAIKFSKMLRDHPEIVSELGPVLDLLLGGGNLQLDGMENASVQTHLEEFLGSIGVQNDEDGSGFHISGCGGGGGNQMSSSNSSLSRQSQEQLEILQYFRNIIYIYSDSSGEYAEVSGRANDSATSKGTSCGDVDDDDSMDTDQSSSSSSSTSSSSFASDDSSSDESSVLEEVKVGDRNSKLSRTAVVMFPARPANLKELAKAKNMSAAQYSSNDNDGDDDSDDDDGEVIGPALSSKIHPRTLLMESESQKSLSLQEQDDLLLLSHRGGVGGNSDNMTIIDETDEAKREEWMMVPGASDGIFVGGANARQFNSGSNARKLAKDYAAQMEVRRKQLEESDEFKRKQEENDQLNAKRGPSLMQLHQMNPDNKSKKMKTSDNSSSRSGGGGRQRFGGEDGDGDGFSFDYEKEMGVNRKMTPKEVQQFLENAEKNKSKFVRGLF